MHAFVDLAPLISRFHPNRTFNWYGRRRHVELVESELGLSPIIRVDGQIKTGDPDFELFLKWQLVARIQLFVHRNLLIIFTLFTIN